LLDIFLDGLKRILKSRIFPLAFIYLALFAVLIHRLFVLQIVEGPTYAEEYEYRDTEVREIKSTRAISMTGTAFCLLQTLFLIRLSWRTAL